ncbi:hypothetical protein Shyd_08510 [Streptomyces hydrogenans]|uniref:Uncharacterized protein n=1 Tax=Streptomyces hydrogenans TaxID=1873719 RepID=A0ABQ3P382_9ACTN|nr:hypothetical protein GCM10018784_26510 [Streptomyces hydrogenans]GHI19480.1 hypothetical protein Shyd_08510 [Streptomyces hydrogenans]
MPPPLHARTYNKTPRSAFPLITGSVWHFLRSAPGRIRTCAHGSGGHGWDEVDGVSDLHVLSG